MSNPYQVVKDFERELCEFTGAKYAVTVNSCTMALLLAVRWHLSPNISILALDEYGRPYQIREKVEIPKYTYASVPMSIIHAGGTPIFRNEEWQGLYQLKPLPVWDSARYFTSDMYNGAHELSLPAREGIGIDKEKFITPFRGSMMCVSFHASKILGDTHGGAILHDNDEADAWFRKARFDGRTEGVAPKDDTFDMIGFHCYLSPDVAARLLLKLSSLSRHNEPLPWGPGTTSDYPDLSKIEVFK